MSQKPIPLFNQETARAKVRAVEDGLMRRRDISANDLEIEKSKRRICAEEG